MKRIGTVMSALAVCAALATPAHAADPPTPPHPSEVTCTVDTGRPTSGGAAMLGVGIGLTATGAVLGLLVGAPALLMRRNALEDADKATYEARQRRYARRVRRREVVAMAALGTGAAFVIIGVPLMIAGARRRNPNRAAITPVVTPTMAGMNARVRF